MSKKRQRVIYFCDETSHVDDVYMAVGGIAVNMNSIQEVEDRIAKLRTDYHVLPSTEIKWNNAKARRRNTHQAYADLLKSLVLSNRVHFHIRFQKMGDWDHRLAGPRRKTDTVSRAYYQLILHRPARYYSSQAELLVRPDNGECTERLPDFVGHLNAEARNKGYSKENAVHSVDCRNSEKTPCLQLLDVTLGALAALRNERHCRPEISATKRELAEHVHDLWGRPDLTKCSQIMDKKFNVWNAKPGSVAAPKG